MGKHGAHDRAVADFGPMFQSVEDTAEVRPHFASPDDAERLTGQNGKLAHILWRAKDEDGLWMSNVELARAIGSLNFTARISDVRAWIESRTRKTVLCKRGKGGLNYYRIVPKGDPDAGKEEEG